MNWHLVPLVIYCSICLWSISTGLGWVYWYSNCDGKEFDISQTNGIAWSISMNGYMLLHGLLLIIIPFLWTNLIAICISTCGYIAVIIGSGYYILDYFDAIDYCWGPQPMSTVFKAFEGVSMSFCVMNSIILMVYYWRNIKDNDNMETTIV